MSPQLDHISSTFHFQPQAKPSSQPTNQPTNLQLGCPYNAHVHWDAPGMPLGDPWETPGMPLGAIGRPLICTCEAHGRPMGCTCNATWMTLGSPNCNTKGCDTISHSLLLPHVTSLHVTMCHHHGCYTISHQVLLQDVTTISAQPITSFTSFTSSSSRLNCIMLHLTSHHKNMQLCASYMLPYVTTRAVTICHTM